MTTNLGAKWFVANMTYIFCEHKQKLHSKTIKFDEVTFWIQQVYKYKVKYQDLSL